MSILTRDRGKYLAILLTLKRENEFQQTPYMLDFIGHVHDMLFKIICFNSVKPIVCFIEYDLNPKTKHIIDSYLNGNKEYKRKKMKFCF